MEQRMEAAKATYEADILEMEGARLFGRARDVQRRLPVADGRVELGVAREALHKMYDKLYARLSELTPAERFTEMESINVLRNRVICWAPTQIQMLLDVATAYDNASSAFTKARDRRQSVHEIMIQLCASPASLSNENSSRASTPHEDSSPKANVVVTQLSNVLGFLAENVRSHGRSQDSHTDSHTESHQDLMQATIPNALVPLTLQLHLQAEQASRRFHRQARTLKVEFDSFGSRVQQWMDAIEVATNVIGQGGASGPGGSSDGTGAADGGSFQWPLRMGDRGSPVDIYRTRLN